MKVVHSWLKEYVGEKLPDADRVADLLTFHSFEVEGVETVAGETVIDVDVLPNRSSDCLCHRGIAREVAALLDTELILDPLQTRPELVETTAIEVAIEDANACPRFTAAVMKDVTVGDSPEWLKQRLEAIGVRSINNIVDATNYVMFALGEPLHAYDADLFPQQDGKWQFSVRYAKPGEIVSLLSEGGKSEDRNVECVGTELLIVDGSTDTPIGLAGVKGGRFAGVHADTKNIIIEAAHFDPTITRKTARRLGIVIDASKRFENEPARELPPYAQAEVIKLITEIAGGTQTEYADVYLKEKPNPKVLVTTKKTNALLGLTLDESMIAKLLRRLGMIVEEVEEGVLSTGPFERTDLLLEEDFIEEVGRLYGLDKITSIAPQKRSVPEINVRQYYSDKIRDILIQLGFSEVITSSFHKKGKIQLRNALASDKSYVRGNLRKNIEQTLDKNYNHTDLLGLADVRVFEIGTVFTDREPGVEEHTAVALGVRTKGNGYSPVDDKTLTIALEKINSELAVTPNWQSEKGVAECNLTELLPKMSIPETYKEITRTQDNQYVAPSAYPAIARDIAMWVPENVSETTVAEILHSAAGEMLVRQTLFDTFTKDGRTSYAFRLVFQSTKKTLTDSEVNQVMDVVYKTAAENNWEVR